MYRNFTHSLSRTLFTTLAIVVMVFAPFAQIHAQGSQASAKRFQEAGTISTADKELFSCGFGFWSSDSLVDCLPAAVYYTVYTGGWAFLWLGAHMFDVFAAFSLSSSVISGGEMVTKGWEVTRDIANSVFIFVLLYIAIATILGIAGGQTKRMLASIILVALVVNFSLFFTRAIIDASNIFALEFYEKMADVKDSPIFNNGPQGIPERDISAYILRGFDPQSLIDKKQFQKWSDGSPGTKAMYLIILFAAAGVLNFIAGLALFATAMIFLARVIVLWILMIIAPIAFVAYAIPRAKGKITDRWWKELINQSFVAPVFLFFLYLILFFIDSGIMELTFNEANGFMQQILYNTLQFIVVIVFLVFAAKTARSMSGQAGDFAVKAGKMIGGAAVTIGKTGVAIGTAGVAASVAASVRPTVGGAARAFSRSKTAESLKTTRAGKYITNFSDKVANTTGDVRNTRLGQAAIRATGVNQKAAGMWQGKEGYSDQVKKDIERKITVCKSITDPDKRRKCLENIAKETSLGAMMVGGLNNTTTVAKGITGDDDYHKEMLQLHPSMDAKAKHVAGIESNTSRTKVLSSIPSGELAKIMEAKRKSATAPSATAESKAEYAKLLDDLTKMESSNFEFVQKTREAISNEQERSIKNATDAHEAFSEFASLEDAQREKVYKKLDGGVRANVEHGANLAGDTTSVDKIRDYKNKLTPEEREKTNKQLDKIANYKQLDDLKDLLKAKKSGATVASADIKKTIDDIKHIDDDTLRTLEDFFDNADVTQHFNEKILKKIQDSNQITLTADEKDKIKNAIVSNNPDTSPARKFLTRNWTYWR